MCYHFFPFPFQFSFSLFILWFSFFQVFKIKFIPLTFITFISNICIYSYKFLSTLLTASLKFDIFFHYYSVKSVL